MPEEDEWFADTGYRAAVVDLLGALAYGELSAFIRLAADAELAPRLAAKGALARLAAVEFGHYELICERLTMLGADPNEAMAPFVAAVDAFHERTAPSDWLEGLVKFYVGDGIAMDFYREVSAFLDPQTRDLVTKALADMGRSEFVVAEVRGALEVEPVQAGRLALWGRRLVGEALSQAQRVVADRDAFSTLLVGSGAFPGTGLAEVVQMFGRITEAHTQRMSQLGLAA